MPFFPTTFNTDAEINRNGIFRLYGRVLKAPRPKRWQFPTKELRKTRQVLYEKRKPVFNLVKRTRQKMFLSFRTSFAIAVFCAFFVLATATAALCQVYQWVDQRGVMHFTSKPPPEDGRLINMFEDENLRRPNPADEPQGIVPAPDAPEDAGQFAVTRVYDGDSFEAEGHNITIQVRLAGIDAPETGKDGRMGQPYSLRAKAFLAEMIENRVVSLKGYGSGSYNRQLAEVFVDGKKRGFGACQCRTGANLRGPAPGWAGRFYLHRGRRPGQAGGNRHLVLGRRLREPLGVAAANEMTAGVTKIVFPHFR